MSAWFERDRIPPGNTVDETGLLLEQIVKSLGLDRFTYVAVRPPRNCRVDIYSTLITTYPQEWIERYIELDYALDDPLVERSAGETRPFFWSTDMHPRNARQRQILAEAHDLGITNGLATPVRGAEGGLGIFNVAASDPERVREAVYLGGEELLAAALNAHEFAVGRISGTQAGSIEDPGLSVRERDCLLWTLEGKTAKDIAAILDLSVFTVHRHAYNATRKLGSLNKHHAAIQAFRAGLI